MGSCIKAQPRPPQPTTPFAPQSRSILQPNKRLSATGLILQPFERPLIVATRSTRGVQILPCLLTFQAAKSTSGPLATLQKKVRYLPGRPLLAPSPIQVRWFYLQTHRLDYMQSVCSCGLATFVAQEPSSPFSLPCSHRSPQSCKGSSPSRRLNSPRNASSHRRTKIPK